jgi:hypothetical protein
VALTSDTTWPNHLAQPPGLRATTDQFQRQVVEIMPGAVMRHHLGFRHTIAWTMPPDE